MKVRNLPSLLPITTLVLCLVCVNAFARPAPSLVSGPKEWLSTSSPSRVMILATPHLSRYKEQLTAADFSPLIHRLSAFDADAIAVESLYSASVFNYQMRQDYTHVVEQFANSSVTMAAEAQRVLALTPDQALANTRFPITSKANGEEQSKELILKLLAGYDAANAQLHWSLLSPQQKLAVPLPTIIKKALRRSAESFNEINIIAIKLAEELELINLYSIDDHSDKDIYQKQTAALFQAFADGKVKIDKTRLMQFMTTGENHVKNKDVVSWYAELNHPDAVAESTYQWQAILDTPLDERAELARISLWELRNANMASNILRAIALNPGKKLLVVVGASHKAYLDDYLSRFSSVEIVQPFAYLNRPQ